MQAGDHVVASMGSVMEAPFWCHACSCLHGTSTSCATLGAALEDIVDVVDAKAFLYRCHPDAPPARADAAPQLPTVTVCDAGLTCAVCLEDLEPGASAVTTPCEHVYHPRCLTRWLEVSGTCPICRGISTPPEGDAASGPDGLILCDLQNGRFALGRRIAGRVFTVGILNKDGKLVRHYSAGRLGVLRSLLWFKAVCRWVKAAARRNLVAAGDSDSLHDTAT